MTLPDPPFPPDVIARLAAIEAVACTLKKGKADSPFRPNADKEAADYIVKAILGLTAELVQQAADREGISTEEYLDRLYRTTITGSEPGPGT
jgi:hypothetical protein